MSAVMGLNSLIFMFGMVIGSFLNVCIYRIPEHEDLVRRRSRCRSCGALLKWYDMIPVVSYLLLRGRCRMCKGKFSVQYPLIEALNGFLYLIVMFACGIHAISLLYCFLASALLVLSVIDYKTYEIPAGINLFILVLGGIRSVLDYQHFQDYLLGFLVVSVPLTVLYYAAGGKAVGGGDVKLMAVSGLFLGWELIITAFILGCILGAAIHIVRMKISGAGRMLAMGPYLSIGIFIAALWGRRILSWYLAQF